MASIASLVHPPPTFTLPQPIPEAKTNDLPHIVSALAAMDQNKRSAAFKANFHSDERPIQTLGQIIGHPELLQTYPKFDSEITDAYLGNTLFVAQVKTTYDIASKDFSEDFSSGGRIVNPTLNVAKPGGGGEHLSPYDAEINRVRFDISNTFSSTLCSVFVTLYSGHRNEGGEWVEERIKGTVLPVVEDNPLLEAFLEDACEKIARQKSEGARMGFTFRDMEAMATFFTPRRFD